IIYLMLFFFVFVFPDLDRRFRRCRKESHLIPPRSSLSNSLFLFFSPLTTVRGSVHHYCFKSFSCNPYESPRKCCKQKTYGLAKPFRCSRVENHWVANQGVLKSKELTS